MSKRVSIIVLAALAVLLALVIGLYAGLLNTGAGRRAVLDALEPSLETALGGEVKIGGTDGNWPRHIVLRDVTVADGEGVWLRLDALSVRWNPFALLSGRVSIDDLTVPGGTLVRLPERPEKEPEPPGLPELPKLPNLEIGSLTVAALDVKAAAAGHDTVLQLTGAADMRPELLQLRLKAATEGGKADRADIRIDWAPAENHLTADIQVTGPEGGLIARVLGVQEGEVSAAVSGKGPASNWTGELAAQAGSFGGLSGKLACDCSAAPAMTLELTGDPGPALSESTRRYLGPAPGLKAALNLEQATSWTLEVTALDMAAAELSRPLRIALTEVGNLLRFDVSGTLVPGPALKDDVPPWLGDSFAILARGGFPREGGVRMAEARIVSPLTSVRIENATLAADGSLDGVGSIELDSPEALSETVAELAGEQATLEFDLAGVWGETLRLEDLVLEAASGARAGGRLAYRIERAALEANLDLTLPAPVFAALTGLPEPAEPVTGKLTAEGALAELSATLRAQTPELTLDARSLPPAKTTLTLRGGLDSPRGSLVILRLDQEQQSLLLSADLAWPGRETLHVTGLKAGIDGATLEGEAHIATATGHMTGEARLDAPDLSVLAAQASGSLTAELSLKHEARGGLVFSAQATAPELAYGNIEAKKVNLSASGPLAALKVEGKAELIEMPDTGPVRDLNVAGEADLAEPLVAKIGKLSAIVDGASLKLTSPVQVTAREGTVALSQATFSWGEKGSVTAQAVLTPDALKARLETENAAIPGQPALVTGFVRVDTEQAEQPGALNLRLDSRDGPEAALEIAGTWNGERLQLKGDLKATGEQAGQIAGELLNVSMPLTLTRTDGSFSVGTEGPLEGRVKYKGKLEPLLAMFLAKPERDLTGSLDADMRIGGTLTAPDVTGKVEVSQGRYENAPTGILLTAINARLDFTSAEGGGSGTLKLSAWDRKDPKGRRAPVTGEGRFDLGPEGMRVDAGLSLRDATLVRRRDLTGTLSGNAKLSGTLPKLALTGAVEIDRLDLLIPEDKANGIVDVPVVLVDEKGEPLDPRKRKKEEQEEAGEARDRFVVMLDLNVRSDGQAFVRGRGLDSEWKADLSVVGTLEQPKLNGALTVKKGTFNFAGQRFDLSKGEVSFTGQTPPDPVLDIVAEHETEEGTTALVRVSGRVSEPSVKLDSRPPLPREQVMALVLFGKPVKDLTALQALQVTQSVAQLTGAGPFGGGSLMDRARRTLGLDLLDLTFGKENGEVGLTVGRYVSEGVFISATQDVTGEGGKVSVEVELTDEFSIETDVGQDASGGVSAQWKKDY